MGPTPSHPTTTTSILEASATLAITQIISHLLYRLAHKPTVIPLGIAASEDPSCPSRAWLYGRAGFRNPASLDHVQERGNYIFGERDCCHLVPCGYPTWPNQESSPIAPSRTFPNLPVPSMELWDSPGFSETFLLPPDIFGTSPVHFY